MIREKQELVFSGVIAVTAAILCFFSLQIGGMSVGAVSPADFPTVLSALIALLAILNLMRCGRDIKRLAASRDDEEDSSEVKGLELRGTLNVLGFFAASVIYVLLLQSIGFVTTTVAYIFAVSMCIRYMSSERLTTRDWLMSLLLAVISAGVLYVVFIEMLNVRF